MKGKCVKGKCVKVGSVWWWVVCDVWRWVMCGGVSNPETVSVTSDIIMM